MKKLFLNSVYIMILPLKKTYIYKYSHSLLLHSKLLPKMCALEQQNIYYFTVSVSQEFRSGFWLTVARKVILKM